MTEWTWNVNQGHVGIVEKPNDFSGSSSGITLRNESADAFTFARIVDQRLSRLRPVWTVVIVVRKLIWICHGRARREGWWDEIRRVGGFMNETQMVVRWGKGRKEGGGGVIENCFNVN